MVISNCANQCPYVLKRRTPGTGFAEDYLCSKTKATTGGTWADFRTIAGYVEWSSELPKDGDFPDWCPLFVVEPGMYDTPKESDKELAERIIRTYRLNVKP